MAFTVGTLAKVLDGFLADHLGGLDTEVRVKALGDYVRGLGMELPHKSMMALARRLHLTMWRDAGSGCNGQLLLGGSMRPKCLRACTGV